MRVTFVLTAASLLYGCGLNDQLHVSGSKPATGKIYLGESRVVASARELDRYACEQGAMICDLRGASYECRCP